MSFDLRRDQPPPSAAGLRTAGWLAGGCAAFCALLALACLASVAAVANQPAAQAAVFKPIVLRAGNFGLSLSVSGTPDCPPEVVDCAVPVMPGQVYGSVWFSIATHEQNTVSLSYKPLLRWRLR